MELVALIMAERACIPITSDVKLESDVSTKRMRAETRAKRFDAIKGASVQTDRGTRHSSIRRPWHSPLRQRQNALLGRTSWSMPFTTP